MDGRGLPKPQSKIPEIDRRTFTVEQASGLMNEACLKFVDCHVSPSELPVLVSTVQRALASYDFLHAEKAKGNVLVVKAPGGSEKEVVLL